MSGPVWVGSATIVFAAVYRPVHVYGAHIVVLKFLVEVNVVTGRDLPQLYMSWALVIWFIVMPGLLLLPAKAPLTENF